MLVRVAVALACVLTLGACGGAPAEPESKAPSPTKRVKPAPATPRPAKPKPRTPLDADGALVPSNLGEAVKKVDRLGSTRGARLFGADLGWPQCPKGMGIKHKETLGAPMPTEAARFVIIGLTNGPSFTPNPCLRDQVAWARQRKLLTAAYAVVSWPHQKTVDAMGGAGSRLDQLRTVGRKAAAYTITQMRGAGLNSPIVWVDVEPVNHYEWRGTTQEQAAVVEGTIAGYRDAGLRVGVYSTPAMYRAIVGDLRLGVPEWRAAGQTSMAEALSRCGDDWSIAGGPGVFGQWVEDNRDRNVTCPGVDLRLGDYFQKF